MKNLVIFASGSGSNAENIIRYFAEKPGFCVKKIYCNVPDAYVLERAKKYNVPTQVFNRAEFRNPDIILRQLQEEGTDFIILAGFLWLVPACITSAYPNRIVNIHPALLPAYGGKGMYGHHVHEAVLAAGEKESGITIHYVNEHYDSGDIIFQATCPVLPDDTPDTLAARVHELEYAHFPRVIEEAALQTPARQHPDIRHTPQSMQIHPWHGWISFYDTPDKHGSRSLPVQIKMIPKL